MATTDRTDAPDGRRETDLTSCARNDEGCRIPESSNTEPRDQEAWPTNTSTPRLEDLTANRSGMSDMRRDNRSGSKHSFLQTTRRSSSNPIMEALSFRFLAVS